MKPLTRNTLTYRTDSSSNSCSINDSLIWAASFSQDFNLLRRLAYEDFPRCHVTATTKKIAGKNVPSVCHRTKNCNMPCLLGCVRQKHLNRCIRIILFLFAFTFLSYIKYVKKDVKICLYLPPVGDVDSLYNT